jgi:phage terminase small subunit
LCKFGYNSLQMLDQHIRFADKYFETLNGSESAIYAGYEPNRSRQTGHDLLERDDIQEYLQVLRVSLAEKTGISQQKVLQEIAKIAFSDIRKYYQDDNNLKPICDLDDNEAAALASVKSYEETIPGTDIIVGFNKEIKMYDKLAGLEKLARHLGLYEKDNDQRKPINNINLTKEAIQKLSDDLDGKY